MFATLAAAALLSGSLFTTPAQEVSRNTLAVAEPVCLGADPATCSALVVLLRARLAAEGYELPTARPTPPCADLACAIALGESLGVRSVATILAVRLEGSVVLLEVSLVDVAGKRVMHADRVKLASSADVEPVSTRLAQSLAGRTPMAATLTPDTVTRAEMVSRRERKIPAVIAGVSLTGVGAAQGYDGMHSLSGGELWAHLEVDRWLVSGMAGAHAGQSGDRRVNETYLDGGVFRMLGTGDVSPIVGGGVGVRHLATTAGVRDDLGALIWEERSGNALWAGGGVMMLRTARIHVFVTGRYSVNLFTLESRPTPHSFSLAAGAGVRF